MGSSEVSLQKKLLGILITLMVSVIGGLIFALIHFPLHWLLGPTTAVLICAKFLPIKLYWPVQIRNTGLIAIGYMLGASFSLETLIDMGKQLPSMFVMTAVILVFSGLLGVVTTRYTGIPLRSTITGSVPGGLTQMLILGEEMKNVDQTIVTFFQILRLIGVIFIVPLLTAIPFFKEHGSAETVSQGSHAAWSPTLIFVYVVIAISAAVLGKKIKLPTAFLLGPIIATAIFVIAGLPAPNLPHVVISISQLFTGAYVGLMIQPTQLGNKTRTTFAAVITSIVLVAFSLLLGLVLKWLYGIGLVTAFLSMAPGGVDQMGIVAKETGASLPIMTSYQMFRVFFILFFVPPYLKWLFNTKWFARLEEKLVKGRAKH